MSVRTWTIIEQGDELVLALNRDGNDAARVPLSEVNALCAALVRLQLRQAPLLFGEDCDD